MGDGVVLVADLWLPTGGSTYPTLLQRTAYDRSNSLNSIVLAGLEPLRAVEEGFVVAIQDVRGRYASGGSHRTFESDRRDGVETINWIRRQDFSNGAVCLYGLSHNALTQLMLASEQPDGLRAIAPAQSAADCHEIWLYQGGAFQLGFCLLWATRFLAPAELHRRKQLGTASALLEDAFSAFAADPWAAYSRTPLVDVEPLAELCPEYVDWLTYPERADFCTAFGLPATSPAHELPALHLGGWYDLFLPGTLQAYESFRQSASAAHQQRLIVGPWGHGVFGGSLGEVDFGPAAALASLDPSHLLLDFFNAVLEGRPPADLPVRLFTMGTNRWRDEEVWPLARATELRLYLSSGGHANSAHGDGALTADEPRGGQLADSFTYDPRAPVPTCGGATFLPGLASGADVGPRRQDKIEERPDVLVYTSAALDRDTEVTGYVSVSLCAASSAPDTDWTAKLVDVHPDGQPYGVCDGIIRARYRFGEGRTTLLTPGAVERYEITLGATSMVFRAGHRVRLEVSSSNFPRFDRNPNTGNPIATDPISVFVAARQTVHHDEGHPSYVSLPVVHTL
jgi:putative CocE/NonD family hydrolase